MSPETVIFDRFRDLPQSGGKGKRRGHGFRCGNGLSRNRGVRRHILSPRLLYKRGMDPMFDIPKNRKPLKVGRICLLIGLTTLLYLLIANRFGDLAGMLLAARVG